MMIVKLFFLFFRKQAREKALSPFFLPAFLLLHFPTLLSNTFIWHHLSLVSSSSPPLHTFIQFTGALFYYSHTQPRRPCTHSHPTAKDQIHKHPLTYTKTTTNHRYRHSDSNSNSNSNRNNKEQAIGLTAKDLLLMASSLSSVAAITDTAPDNAVVDIRVNSNNNDADVKEGYISPSIDTMIPTLRFMIHRKLRRKAHGSSPCFAFVLMHAPFLPGIRNSSANTTIQLHSIDCCYWR